MKEFQDLETKVDKRFKNLKIWNCSMQSIISNLLFAAELIDFKGEIDTAMDYVSRTSYLLDSIKEYGVSAKARLSSDSIIEAEDHIEDIQFLNAYSHLSMLMPQFYKKTFAVHQKSDVSFKLEFSSEEIEKAEIIDRLYSGFAQQMVINYKDSSKFREYLDYTIKSGRGDRLLNDDFLWIKRMYEHFYRYNVTIEVVPSSILKEICGFDYEEYRSFCAAVRAFAEYYIELGRSFKRYIDPDMSDEDKNFNMAEYINWTVPGLKHQTIGMIQGISGLSNKVFLNILSYYTYIFEDNTGEEYMMNAKSGEAFTPPFMLLDDLFIQSPYCMRYMLPINNVLYSLNKNNPDVFNNEFSSHLEPTLVNQLLYIFSSMENVKCKPNVILDNSEIDLLVLSTDEKVCLNIQVKATIAPDSARTVRNVESRVIEGFDQLEYFSSEPKSKQLRLINDTFLTELGEVKLINLLVVRSSAGSGKSWIYNDKFKIINYPLLAALINRKIELNQKEIGEFDKDIQDLQDEILAKSKPEIQIETLQIDDYEIDFPNIYFKGEDILGLNLSTFKNLPLFEKASPLAEE